MLAGQIASEQQAPYLSPASLKCVFEEALGAPTHVTLGSSVVLNPGMTWAQTALVL